MGRIDSQEDLAAFTESFRRQGFTKEEMIGLVACGHTLGGVRFPDFPQIVDSPDGEQKIDAFDTSPKFDNAVVTEYLDGTTKNPLVAHKSQTILSDLRIFSSDNNVTMKKMTIPEAFANTCRDLLERVINTVPKGVTLSEVIKPLPVKVDGVQLSVAEDSLRFQVMLRLSTPNDKRGVTLRWENRNGGPCPASVCASQFKNSDSMSTTLFKSEGMDPVKYWFDTPVNATTSMSKFWFEVDERDGSQVVVHDNGAVLFVYSGVKSRIETMK